MHKISSFLKNNFSAVLLSGVLLFLIIPIFYILQFPTPLGDDLSLSNQFFSAYKQTSLINILHFWKKIYLEWQGTYFGNFIVVLPVFKLFGLTVYRVQLFFFDFLFFISTFLFFRKVINTLGFTQTKHTLFIFITFLFFVISYIDIDQIFMMQNCAGMYTVPISFVFLSLYFYLLLSENFSCTKLVLCCLFAFFGAGGPLNISTFLCGCFFILILLQVFVKKEKISKINIVFLVAFIGTVINLVAPGNFVRAAASQSSEKLQIFKSVCFTFQRILLLLKENVLNGTMLLLFFVSFKFFYKKIDVKNFDFKYPVIFTALSFLLVFAIIFPVILGYSDFHIPSRCSFVEKMAFYFMILFISIYWAGYLSIKKTNIQINKKAEIAIFVLLAAILINPFTLKHNTFIQIPYYLVHGDYSSQTKEHLYVMEMVKNSETDDVVVHLPAKNYHSQFLMLFDEDGKNPVLNDTLTSFYGKKSLKIIRAESD